MSRPPYHAMLNSKHPVRDVGPSRPRVAGSDTCDANRSRPCATHGLGTASVARPAIDEATAQLCDSLDRTLHGRGSDRGMPS